MENAPNQAKDCQFENCIQLLQQPVEELLPNV